MLGRKDAPPRNRSSCRRTHDYAAGPDDGGMGALRVPSSLMGVGGNEIDDAIRAKWGPVDVSFPLRHDATY